MTLSTHEVLYQIQQQTLNLQYLHQGLIPMEPIFAVYRQTYFLLILLSVLPVF